MENTLPISTDELDTLLFLRVIDRAETHEDFIIELDYERNGSAKSNNPVSETA